jgi:hypothetical protein
VQQALVSSSRIRMGFSQQRTLLWGVACIKAEHGACVVQYPGTQQPAPHSPRSSCGAAYFLAAASLEIMSANSANRRHVSAARSHTHTHRHRPPEPAHTVQATARVDTPVRIGVAPLWSALGWGGVGGHPA